MDQPNENKDFESVSDFFEGKSVFLTGASGFIGTVLLETLLRCCPGIASIYILLRSKGDLMPEKRKELIFDKKVFSILKDRSPEVLQKVHVIDGDISKPEFGMNKENLQCVTEKVSIVYHCAANLNLVKTVRYMTERNCGSTKTMIELCRKMKKFCVLVYTSTSYSNCNHQDFPVKEEVYRLPFHAQKFLDALKDENNERLLELTSMCKPDWPNWYTFSKCLSENILQDTASDLSIAIIRPSIVGCTWKSPMPGYLDLNSAVSKSGFSVGQGFIKVLCGGSKIRLNIIPADVVSNMHLIAAWSIGTKKASSPLVVNCTSTGSLHEKAAEVFKTVKRIRRNFLPAKYSESHKKVFIVKNILLYWIIDVYQHFLRGIITDIILKIKGKKPRVLALYCIFHKLMLQLRDITIKSLEYERSNMYYLNDLLHDEDKKIFDNDIQNLKLEELLGPAFQEAPSYDWKKYQEIMIQYDWLISFIQYMILIFGCSFIYWMTIMMFRQFQLI